MEIIADGFLYNMVRSIMGTLINVGDRVDLVLGLTGSTFPARKALAHSRRLGAA
jgi:tRNA U38,U39,U40 pseudouridine synthase TruA